MAAWSIREEVIMPEANPQPPVLKHREWRHLLKEVERNPSARVLKTWAGKATRFLLSPVVSMAWYLAAHHPELLAKPRLRILVAGAEILDADANGRNYGFMPALLGRPELELEVSLVGPAIQPMPEHQSYAGLANPATCHEATLAAFMADRTASEFDIVFALHAGLESHAQSWLNDEGLLRLAAAGVPVVLSAYADLDAAIDVNLARAHGWKVGTPVLNPFRTSLGDRDDLAMANLLMHPLGLPEGGRPAPADAEAITYIQALGQNCMQMGCGLKEGAPLPGEPIRVRELGEPVVLVGMEWMTLATGQFFEVGEQGMRPLYSVAAPPELLIQHPGPKAQPWAWADWAIRLGLDPRIRQMRRAEAEDRMFARFYFDARRETNSATAASRDLLSGAS